MLSLERSVWPVGETGVTTSTQLLAWPAERHGKSRPTQRYKLRGQEWILEVRSLAHPQRCCLYALCALHCGRVWPKCGPSSARRRLCVAQVARLEKPELALAVAPLCGAVRRRMCVWRGGARAQPALQAGIPVHGRGVSSRGAGHAPSLTDPTSSRFRHGHLVECGGESVTGGESS